MWVISTDGFYSVVQKKGDEKLTVRTRAKEDLEALINLHLLDDEGIIEHEGTDYPFRTRTTLASWIYAVGRMAAKIDYSNFKDEVYKKQGEERAAAYSGVWRSLLALELGNNEWEEDEKDG